MALKRNWANSWWRCEVHQRHLATRTGCSETIRLPMPVAWKMTGTMDSVVRICLCGFLGVSGHSARLDGPLVWSCRICYVLIHVFPLANSSSLILHCPCFKKGFSLSRVHVWYQIATKGKSLLKTQAKKCRNMGEYLSFPAHPRGTLLTRQTKEVHKSQCAHHLNNLPKWSPSWWTTGLGEFVKLNAEVFVCFLDVYVAFHGHLPLQIDCRKGF